MGLLDELAASGMFGAPVGEPGGADAIKAMLSRMLAPTDGAGGAPSGGFMPGDMPPGVRGSQFLPQGPMPQPPAPAAAPAGASALSPFMSPAPMGGGPQPAPQAPPSSPDVTSPVPVRPGDQYTGVSPGDPGARRRGQPASGDGAPAPNVPPTSLLGRVGGAMAPDAPPGIGDRLAAGFMGFANGKGLLPALGNLVGGIASGKRQDPVGMQQQGYADAFRAMRDAGIPPHQAMAAIASAQAGHPEILHATAEQFGLPKAQQTGEDMLGNKQFAVPGGTNMNPQFQTPQTVTPQQAAIARQPESFQRQMFFRGQGTVYQGADGHVLKRVGNKVIDQMTGQEVRG